MHAIDQQNKSHVNDHVGDTPPWASRPTRRGDTSSSRRRAYVYQPYGLAALELVSRAYANSG